MFLFPQPPMHISTNNEVFFIKNTQSTNLVLASTKIPPKNIAFEQLQNKNLEGVSFVTMERSNGGNGRNNGGNVFYSKELKTFQIKDGFNYDVIPVE